MLTKLNSLPSTVFFFNKPSLSKSTTIVSLFSTTNSSLNLTQTSPYGPSLHKGTTSPLPNTLSQNHDQGEDEIINVLQFTRVFHVAALRVPSKDCFILESRLRGHLLNWPRIRNIARVPGDEIDDDVIPLLDNPNKTNEEEEGITVSLNRRMKGKAERDGERLSPVLYREKLVKSFNSRGFVSFRNLARISRPRRRKGKEIMQWKRREEERKDIVVVEVVEVEEEEMRGLLGEGFTGGKKWKGSTRLLLLDERLVDKGVEELPLAIQAILNEDTKDSMRPSFELVRCKLTLFYDYWQMNEILEAMLPNGMIIPSAFETVGHIAHLNLRDEHIPYKKLIAKVVLDKNKPKIQTVVNKIDVIHNDYRTMELEILAGNHSLVTTVVENGLRFNVDLAAVYWNSRLATERRRILDGFNHKDVVCDVFSGVGPIALSAAKIVKRVYANDLNPHAVDYLERNCVLNKLERKIEVYNMDGRRFINAMFTSEKAQSITHVIMNLPNDAAEYLDAFRGVYRDRPNNREFSFPMIHVYGFSKARDPEFDFHERIRIALSEVAVNVEMRKVRLVAPGKWMLCASFILPASVAFA
ncbi:Met_10 domain-containing protein [Cephalotus follicularis]|uniref:tRNA (guanine(37)-N1)-methyltransferase n=1 Tax=Cephalotus follicularis TaxID=3775 RepID=A0A1Q3C340_CEPFO|nr:Met_10 domain-containing protein [Cephalotus follicularis]